MLTEFPHKQLSHCENGAITNLLNFRGLQITEPLVFGIGSGLFFAYMPFVKNYGIPLVSYRILPGKIQKNATQRLGIDLFRKTFKDKQKAMDEMDQFLEKGQPVGLLTNLYYLPFFPKSYRFHYNAHNTVIYGKRENTYLVSDPVIENVSEIDYNDLLKARFAKGIFTVSGNMYFPENVPSKIDWRKAITKGIRATCNMMIKNPIPYHGVSGIKLLAKRISKEINRGDKEFVNLFLGNIIRMQEEAGTGGAGFRFMYASFLQEAADKLQIEKLSDLSINMTAIGDRWRDYATIAARLMRGRMDMQTASNEISSILLELHGKEKDLFKTLNKSIYA